MKKLITQQRQVKNYMNQHRFNTFRQSYLMNLQKKEKDMRSHQALILSAALLTFFSMGVIAQKPDLTSSDSCHKATDPTLIQAKAKHAAAAPQEPPPADGKVFCYNYKRPDKKNVPCKCTNHRDDDGKCRPVWQEGPNRCSNHCRADMCKCTNPCKT